MQPEIVESLVSYSQYYQTQKNRLQLRKSNLQEQEDDFFGGNRKSAQIKVIQKFISKLKSDNKNHEAILTELQTLNMTKYIQQVSAIIANAINDKEITFYGKIASKLNTSYRDVPSIMIKDLNKVFNNSVESAEDNKTKLKAIFLFVAELFVSGFSFSYKEVIDMLKMIFKSGKFKKMNHASELEGKLFIYWYSSYTFVTFLLTFGDIFTKKVPVWVEAWQKQGKQIIKFPQVIPIKIKGELTLFFTKYANQCYQILKEITEKIKSYESELFECLKKQGEFNKELERNYNDTIDKFLVTRQNLKQIVMAINQPIDLSVLEIKITQTQKIIARYINKAENAEIFEDQFQKEIYQNIQDCFTDAQEKNATEEAYKQFRPMLDNCKNVQDSYQITKEFSKINSKKTRKLLAKDIMQYRKEYHLVTPYLCRVVAMINKKYKDLGEFVNELIFNEYEKLKDNSQNTFVINDKKSRYFKYICEFTKLGVIDPEKTMNCIEHLIENLNGYNIELMVSLLENVGRFLHLSEASANRFTFLMNKYENVIKKKSFSIFTTSQLTNSINLLKPRKQTEKKIQRELTPLQIQAQQVMSKCIYDELQIIIKESETLLKTQEGINALQQQFLNKVAHFDYINSYNYAYLLQQLNHEQVSNYIVDKSIQNMLLFLVSGQNQKSILWAKFIAELYIYKQLKRPLLFSTIYNIMKVPSNQIGNINAICSILEACTGYLNSKKTNKNNQKFMLLTDFRRYISKSKYIPMLEQFQIIEVLESYHPDFAEISIGMLNSFIAQIDNKMNKENQQYDYFDQFERFLDRKNLRKKKQMKLPEEKEYREKTEEIMEKTEVEKGTNTVQESKAFDKELVDIMEETRKEYSSRIAKPVFLEKNIQKRKEKKKQGKCITVIARNGTRFVRKDLKTSSPTTKQ